MIGKIKHWIKRALHDPSLVLGYLLLKFDELRFGLKPKPVPQEELINEGGWDSLIILDACRYDIFKEVTEELDLKGNLRKTYSKYKRTESWVKGNWNGKQENTILISGSPFYWKLGFASNFKEDFPVWKPDEYMTSFGATRSDVCLEKASELRKKYKEAKFLIHLIPPIYLTPRKREKNF